MDLYSTALGLALAALGAGALAAGLAWLAARGGQAEEAAARRLARRAAVTSLSLTAFALVYHLLAGHRPGTAESMGVTEFLLEHPAFVLGVGGAAVVLWWQRRGAR